QVLAWGLRGLRGAVREPRLELQWGEQSLWTPPIQDMATDPNFPSNVFVLTLALPEEERFVPPIRLRLWDRADTDRRLLLGQASVGDLGRYRCHPPRQEQLPGSGRSGSGSHTVVSMPGTARPIPARPWCHLSRSCPFLGHLCPPASAPHQDKEDEEEEEEEERDWWSKFYASMEDKDPKSPRGTNGDRLKIYGCELEAVPEFEGLQDFCQTFPLSKPGRAPVPGQHPEPVGSFKVGDPPHPVGSRQRGGTPGGHGGVSQGLFRIYPVPEEAGAAPAPRCFQRLPPRQPQPCLVRVYVVRAFDLSPRDVTGLSDPYVRVALGKKTLGRRDQYVPNTLEPVFGRCGRVALALSPPGQVAVSPSGWVALAVSFPGWMAHVTVTPRMSGPGSVTPGVGGPCHCHPQGALRGLIPDGSVALCQPGLVPPGRHSLSVGVTERGHPPPRHPGAPRERLALHVLNLCELVPEHLETRGLQSRARPGLEQGKVQMWVDIFPTSLGPPGPPVNIDPRKAEGYELRCVVWNVRDTDLGDINLLGQRMSDIYVTGWLDGLPEQRQHTDIHYRSLDGNGAFNWRFVFAFEFLVAEKLCAIRRKEHVWSLDETLLKVPPKLILQVWDNDKFKADDLLGILELELTRLPRPASSARLCRASPRDLSRLSRAWLSLARLSRCWCRAPALQRSPLNLFRRRRARGWWPCTMQDEGGQRLSGKLELSLELLTAREAEQRPVGKAREEPNKHPTLPEP
ncbi:MYOF protein, partial [Vidua chalybeata]|nr:MYOF protein [Vidua chalybeata]